MAAGAALEQKKKVDELQADADAKLKKSNAQLEKLKKELEAMKTSDSEQVAELAEVKAKVAAL